MRSGKIVIVASDSENLKLMLTLHYQDLHIFDLHFDVFANGEGIPFLERSNNTGSLLVHYGLRTWSNVVRTSVVR